MGSTRTRRGGEPMRRERGSCAPAPTTGRGSRRVEGGISRAAPPRPCSPAPTSRRGRVEYRGCSPPESRVTNLLGASHALERSTSPSRRNGLGRHRTAPPAALRSSSGPRAASPGARRGRERHREVARGNRLGSEFRGSASPDTRRGCDRHRVATPGTRRGCDLRCPGSPDTRRGRERHRHEKDGPRGVRDGVRCSSTRRGRCSATPRSDRPRTGSPAPNRGRRSTSGFPIQRGQVSSETYTPPTQLGLRPAASQNGSRPDSPAVHCNLKRPRDQGSLRNSEHEEADTGGDDAAEEGSLSNEEEQKTGKDGGNAAENLQGACQGEGGVKQMTRIVDHEPPIVSIHDDLFSQIFTRLEHSAACKLAAAGKCMVKRVQFYIQDHKRIPFLGAAMLNQGKFGRVISFKDRRLAQEVKPSAMFIEKSLRMIPGSFEILDCRFGYVTLKQSDSNGLRFYLWDPFLPNRWIAIPNVESSHCAKILAGSLFIPSMSVEHFSVVLLCLESQKFGLDTLSIEVFKSESSEWRRLSSSVGFRENECIDKNAVHSDGCIHFLSKKTRRIIKIDPNHIGLDVIYLLDDHISPQVILAGIDGILSLATQSNGVIMISQYKEKQWQMLKKLRCPQAFPWTLLTGSCPENGFLVAETSLEQSHIVDIDTGRWMELEPHCTGHQFVPLEMKSPYKFPFPIPRWQPGNSMLVASELVAKKRKKKISKKDVTEGIRITIEKLFESQGS